MVHGKTKYYERNKEEGEGEKNYLFLIMGKGKANLISEIVVCGGIAMLQQSHSFMCMDGSFSVNLRHSTPGLQATSSP